MHIQVTLQRFVLALPLILAFGCSISDSGNVGLVSNVGYNYEAQADTLFFYRKLSGAIDGRQVSLDITRERDALFAFYTDLITGQVVRFNGANTIDESGRVTLLRYDDDLDTLANGASEEIVGTWNAKNGILQGRWKKADKQSDVYFATDSSSNFVKVRMAQADSVSGDCGDFPCLSIRLTWPELEGPRDYTIINQTILSYVTSSPHFMRMATGGTVQGFVDSMARHFQIEQEDAKLVDGYRPTWSRDFTGKVVHNQKGLISLELEDFAYSGGAHPNQVTILLSFDYENDSRLGLGDVFIEGAFEALDTLAIQQIRKHYNVPEGQSLGEFGFFIGDENPFALPENFCVEPDGVRFLFNPYEIAPYVFGGVEVKFNYRDIIPFLQPHFKERIGI